MKKIECKQYSNLLREQLKKEIEDADIQPMLVVISVGNDEASAVYARNKQRACEKANIVCHIARFPADVQTWELVDAIEGYGVNEHVDGIMVELPLPPTVDKELVLNAIPPEKDVDCLSALSMGRLLTGQKGFAPCTPLGIVKLLDMMGEDLSGKEVCIINRSNLIGKPLAAMMTQRSATVTVCHSKTRNLAEHTRRADIIVTAVDKPNFLTYDMVKDGAIVIDVTVKVMADGTMCGDVDESVELRSGLRTPVPGGVGLMTTSMMLWNTFEAAKRNY